MVSNAERTRVTSYPCESGAGLLAHLSNPLEIGVANSSFALLFNGGWVCSNLILAEEAMASEGVKIVEGKLEEPLKFLRGCLVDGDAREWQIQKRVRRRALLTSVALQSMALTLLLLAPLFGKTERLTVKDWVKMLPLEPVRNIQQAERKPRPLKPGPVRGRFIFNRPLPPSDKASKSDASPIDLSEPTERNGARTEDSLCSWCRVGGTGDNPRPPENETSEAKVPQRVHLAQIDPAMLKLRVEPIYPILAKLTHHSGRVELRATIGTDGKIRSLQVAVGDPLLTQSAIDAVGQWVYKPTILNGQAVEVDTYITVIYSSQK
jgi:TonB family protein